MRIKKVAPTTSLQAQVVNTYNTSDTDTYSCEYINGIVEKGSNANGTYIKFKNGLLINMKTISGTTTATLWENNIYYKDISNGDWAYPFDTIINCQATNVTNQYWCCVHDELTSTSAGRTRIVRASAGSSESSHYKINIFAIGTWSDNSNTRTLQESKKSVSEDNKGEEENFEDIEPIEDELEDEKK